MEYKRRDMPGEAKVGTQVLLTPLAIVTMLGFFIVGAVALVTKSAHIRKVAVALDQVSAAIWYGTEDLTVSHNIGVKKVEDRMNSVEKAICWTLRKFDSKHCVESIGY